VCKIARRCYREYRNQKLRKKYNLNLHIIFYFFQMPVRLCNRRFELQKFNDIKNKKAAPRKGQPVLHV